MKSLKMKLGAGLTVLFLTLSLVSCSPYAGVGVSTGYGAPYGYYGYGYRPYGGYYGYGYPSYRVAPRPYYAPRAYNARPYAGGGSRGSFGGGGRGSFGGGRRGR